MLSSLRLEGRQPRQLVLTASRHLAAALKRHCSALKATAEQATAQQAPSDSQCPSDEPPRRAHQPQDRQPAMLDDYGVRAALAGLPPKLSDLEDSHFPLVLSFDMLLGMMDNQLRDPSSASPADVSRRVDAGVFTCRYWPHMNEKARSKAGSAAIVWSEIAATIKGSLEAVKSPGGRLGPDAYLALAEGRHGKGIEKEQRAEIYKLFQQYEKMKVSNGAWDFADVVGRVSRGWAAAGGHKLLPRSKQIEFVYVDEVQDCSMGLLHLLRCLPLAMAGPSSSSNRPARSHDIAGLKPCPNGQQSLHRLRVRLRACRRHGAGDRAGRQRLPVRRCTGRLVQRVCAQEEAAKGLPDGTELQVGRPHALRSSCVFFPADSGEDGGVVCRASNPSALLLVRTHQEVVDLAHHATISVLLHWFPASLDKLSREHSEFRGELPVLLSPGAGNKDILSIMRTSSQRTCSMPTTTEGDRITGQQTEKEDLNSTTIQFGADQAILVYNEAEQKRAQDIMGDGILVLTVEQCKGLEFEVCARLAAAALAQQCP